MQYRLIGPIFIIAGLILLGLGAKSSAALIAVGLCVPVVSHKRKR